MRIVFVCLLLSSACFAQEPVTDPAAQQPPGFQATVGSVLAIQAQVPDIAKLEAKAKTVLTNKYKMTAAQATAELEPNGQVDVQRCIDYIVLDLLSTVTQATITGASVIAQHPVVSAK